MADTASALAPGTRVGSFVIEARLGAGDVAAVYRAYEPTLHRRVALKILAPELAADRDFVTRFTNESLDAAQLQHPDIVAVYEVGRDGDASFIASRLVTGSTLESMLARRGRLPVVDALAILERAGRTLDHAHRRGFVHGDLKPSNIFLERGGHVSLADFGPSKATVKRPTTSTGSANHPIYVSPEQASGTAPDARSDVFSFACVAFESLTGEPPYRRDDMAGFLRQGAPFGVPVAPEHTSALPAAVDAVFRHALAPDPAARPANVVDFLDELRGALGFGPDTRSSEPAAVGAGRLAEGPVGTEPAAESLLPAHPPRTVPATEHPVRKRRALLAGVGVVLLVALVAGLALVAFGSGGGSNAPTASTLGLARSQLILGAPLDGTDTGFVDRIGRSTQNASVKAVPGALEFTVQPTGDAGRDLAITTGVVDYLLQLDFSVAPASQVKADIGVRWSADSKIGDLLRIDTVEGNATFARFERGATPQQSRIIAVGDQVKLPGITAGRVQHLAIVVRGNTLQLYRDRVQLVSTADPKMPSTPTSPGIDVLGVPRGGTVRVVGLQLRSLPPS